jgi:hypothetical protein
MSKQKRKGDGYERELAKWLDHWLFDDAGYIHRAPLSGGGRNNFGGGEADLNGVPFMWVEAKRTERFSPYPAMEQAERGIEKSRSRDIPVVINRKNNMDTAESLVVMRLGDWLPMYKAFLWEMGITTMEPNGEEANMQIIFTPDEDEPEDNVVPLSKSKTNLKLVVNNGEEEM